jgi:hypothetical protein
MTASRNLAVTHSDLVRLEALALRVWESQMSLADTMDRTAGVAPACAARCHQLARSARAGAARAVRIAAAAQAAQAGGGPYHAPG